MRIGSIVPITAAIISSAFLAANGYAQGFGGHHHGMSAMRPCIAVMSSSQKATLKQTLSSEKQTFKSDHQNLASAKQALVATILAGNKDVSSQESALASAQQQMQKDQDAMAQQVCGQLSTAQLSAAQSLFNSMTTLRANQRQQMQSLFQQAQAAAGNSQNGTSE